MDTLSLNQYMGAIVTMENNMIGKFDNNMQFHEVALRLREQRQQVLASNIANADTPNYKARDFNFAQAMQHALAPANSGASELSATNSAHFSAGSSAVIGGVPLQYRAIHQGSVDGNTVDMDVERNQFTDNALRYEASLTIMTGQIKDMLVALQQG
jgi:flagellar basal-body rod protein FlgB